jgi:TRAP-type C4-dicarboxylate transport system permease small subunit
VIITSNKEREFQLAILKVQLKHESTVSLLTTFMAVIIALAVTVIALSFSSFFSNLPPDTESLVGLNFGLMVIALILTFVLLCIAFYLNSRRSVRELNKIQEDFIKPRKTEKSRQE